MKLWNTTRLSRSLFGAAATFAARPGFSHALLGVAITLMVGAIFAVAPLGPWGSAAVCAFLMYAMRERRQSEEHFGSNRIPLWQWKPRAWRDMAWPALAGAMVAALIEWIF